MQSFPGEEFLVKIEASFKCDNPTFDSFQDALDCYYKAVELMIRWKHHDVKISLVQRVFDDEFIILDTVIE